MYAWRNTHDRGEAAKDPLFKRPDDLVLNYPPDVYEAIGGAKFGKYQLIIAMSAYTGHNLKEAKK
jgi:hypothetical protein